MNVKGMRELQSIQTRERTEQRRKWKEYTDRHYSRKDLKMSTKIKKNSEKNELLCTMDS